MNIRTHTTTVDSFGGLDDMGPGWEPGTPVLVVAGLPDRCDLRPLCQVPEGWEWQGAYGTWIEANQKVDTAAIGVVLCRPVPVPAPPATAREIAADELRVAEQHGCGFTDIGPTAVADRIIDRLSVAGLLAGPAPTGDDEPTDTTVIRGLTRRFDGEPQADTPAPECDFGCDDEKGTTECLIHYPQADTPAPRWVVDGDGDLAFLWSKNVRMTVTRNDLGWVDDAGWDALVDLVRRDGTAPTVDLTPLFAAFDTYEASDTQPWRDQYRADVLAAVRALRDGGTR